MSLFEIFLLILFLIIGAAFFVILAIWIGFGNAKFGKSKEEKERNKWARKYLKHKPKVDVTPEEIARKIWKDTPKPPAE